MFPQIPKPSSKATSKHSIAMEPGGDSPPIWSPPSALFVPARRQSRLSSFLNPMTLTIAFSVLIFIIFFLLPPTLSRNNQALKPDSSVKKSWNSINILLVLFAVLCGVFARINEESSSSDGAETVQTAYEFVNSGRPSVSGGFWLENPDWKVYDKTSNYMNTGGNRLRRSSSSYPDLRRASLWGSDGEKLKYFDDFEVDFHRPPGNSHRHVRQSHEVEKDVVAETPVREIPVDKFELKNSVPPPPTQPIKQVPKPPPPPPTPVKRKRSVHSVPRQYNVERGGRKAELNETRSSIPPPSKTPPPPSELKFHPLAERREKIQRKKSGTTKEIATAIVSLYQGTQTNRKKKVKSRDIFESVAQNPSPQTVPASIPPVPPPPPPPPSSKKVLQNFFRKSSKSKLVHSVSTANPPPPPPPPPPPSSIFNSIFKTGSKTKRFQLTSASSPTPPPPPPPPPPPSSIFNSLFKNGTKSRRLKYIETQPPPPLPPTQRSRPKISLESTGKPPKPTKPSASHHESVVFAPASPLIHMPPPPPPPPFRMPEMKFIVKGDFIRIRSADSSPGREDHDVMSVKSDCGDSIGPSFTCPSPDVDSKADTFISKRRDEWRLEKINSFKEPRNTGSWSAGLG